MLAGGAHPIILADRRGVEGNEDLVHTIFYSGGCSPASQAPGT